VSARTTARGASREFAELLGAGPQRNSAIRTSTTAAPGELLGLEHEFEVARDGEPIDFRRLVTDIELDGKRLDPGDPLAHRCRWGGVITADGREAEIASPPVAAAPGFTGELAGWAARGRAELAAALPHGATLSGYSTHLSVSIPDHLGPRLA
jgi:hypothetical protein